MEFAEDSNEERLRAGQGAEAELIVDVDGFEGPLDLLLALAREQKVDLARISILQLVEQYIAYIERLKEMRLDIAAEYLVTAAWLAYLKSRLLLPETEDEEPSGEEMAGRLAFQLQRLEAIRKVAGQLMSLPRAGLDVHYRGGGEGIRVISTEKFECSLYDLLKAYAVQREAQGDDSPLHLHRGKVLAVEDALKRLRALIPGLPGWAELSSFLPKGLSDPFARRSAMASTLLASLELAKQGQLQVRQLRPFGPIHLHGHKGHGENGEGG